MAESSPDLEVSDTVTYWLGQIEGAQKHQEKWYTRGKAVIDRYMEEALANALPSAMSGDIAAAHKMNTLWSNVETITPALYAKTPNANVQRRYRDKDPVGKWAAITLERSLDYTFDAYDVDYSIKSCVQDYLLPGRGQAWLSYEPSFGQGAAGSDGKPTETLAWEYCKTKHLNWKDFLTNPARTWDEVWWGAQRAYLSKEEVEKRFSKAVADKLTFTENKEDNKGGDDKGERVKKAAIWEIWCKTTGLTYFVSKSCPDALEKPKPPPIDFEGFWPFPRPLTATTTPESIIPTPDFCFYQNQADEIDKLTQRINLLTSALRVAGVYDATQEALGRLLEDSSQNIMIPATNWAVFGAAGGIKGSVDFFPLAEIIQALEQCYASRDAAKQTMYEVTGISDIVRGASNPKETLGAQQIKTQWGALRIRDRQSEVQRFVRDIMRLKSEIIAEHFQLETLKTMSNCPILMQAEKQKFQQRKQIAAQAQQMAAQNPQMAQQIAQANPQLAQMAQPLSLDDEQKLREPSWEEVYALLRDQKLRSFRIDIETDSTINADEQEEKAARVEFITAATSFITAWGPIIQMQPKLAPLGGEMLLFASRAFKTADSLESEIENMVDMMSQQAMMPPQQNQPPPDPKIQAETQRHQETLAFDKQKHADEMNFKSNQADADRAHELQKHNAEIGGQVQVAQAQQPRSPSSTEMIPALAPLYEQVSQMLAAIAQGNQMMQQGVVTALQASAASQQQMAESVAASIEGSQQKLEKALTQLAQALQVSFSTRAI